MIVVDRLVWTQQNITHIARHDVTSQEVEEVCHGNFVIVDTRNNRILLVGPTKKGRAIAIVLDAETDVGVYYPVTARSADRKERRIYNKERGVTL